MKKSFFIIWLLGVTYSFIYLSPGIAIGKNNNNELFLSLQLSIGHVFAEDLYDESQYPFSPSLCFGAKYYPSMRIFKEYKLLPYIDFQISIPTGEVINYEGPGMIGIAYGYSKKEYWVPKMKYYIGPGVLFLNYEKELQSNIKYYSVIGVFPLPYDEWVP